MSLWSLGEEESPSIVECSRAGCRAVAGWRIDWRNPKIHSADRMKTWVACAEHREFLTEFVNARGFLLEVSPIETKQ